MLKVTKEIVASVTLSNRDSWILLNIIATTL